MFSSDMMLALKARWKLVVLVMTITAALAALWVATTQRVYVARASLLFDGGPNPSVQENGAAKDNQSLLGTQADLIKSSSVAHRVAIANRLSGNAALTAAWRQSGAKGPFDSWLVQYLLASVEVTPEKDSNVLAVGFKSSDPGFAARMANSFAQQFVSARLQISTDAAKQYASWFQQRTTEVRRNLEAAQSKLGDFQRSHGMVSGNSLALEADRLSSLSTQLASAESSAADLRARAGTRVSRSPDVQSSAVVASLRQQIASTDAKVALLSSTYGDNHPDLVAARSELTTLRAELGNATAAASEAVRIASSAASSREGQLRGLVNGQRGRMLQLTGFQSQFEALQSDVTTAQNAYDAVTQRLNLMRLQSGLPTTNVQQIDRATRPLLPASPNVPLLALLALLGGLALGIIAAMISEWRSPLVRSAGGLFDSTGLPVLGNFTFATFRPEPALALRGI
jgi:uncharacterized protein involved in exopolysaccharide biosynthesis